MKQILLLTTLAMVALGGPHPAHGQAPVEAWVQRFDGATASAMAVDGSNNVFVLGSSIGSGSGYDYMTIKYSGAGETLWSKYYGSSDDDYATALAVDGSNNVIVTGYLNNNAADYATVKYSGAGVPLWTNRYNGPGNSFDYAIAVKVDGSNNVFVLGSSIGSGSGYDYATIKYSGAGVPLWTNRYNGPGNGDDIPRALAVDGSGNVIVTGRAVGIGSGNDYATVKYSGEGVLLWDRRYDSISDDQAVALAVDGSGDVFVTGSADGDYATIKYSRAGVALWTNRYDGTGNAFDGGYALTVDGSGNVFVTGRAVGIGSGDDYATIKYSGAGVPLWTNCYNGTGNSYDIAADLAVDGSGNVVVLGQSVGIGGGYDLATIKYSGAGVALWTNRYDGTGNAFDSGYAQAVAVNSSGDVFVTGSLWSLYTWSLYYGSYDLVTIKYSSAVPPLLTIVSTTTNTVAISWPSPSTGFTLQQNTESLATLNWSNVLTTPTDNGTTKIVIVNLPTADRFYRLKNP